MADLFPAIQRYFASDAECVRRCRKLYQRGDDEKAPKPFAAWNELGGEQLDTFDADVEAVDGEFLLFSEKEHAAQIRLMMAALQRRFDDGRLYGGDFGRIDATRTGRGVIERDDEGLMTGRVPYRMYAVGASLEPAVRGG